MLLKIRHALLEVTNHPNSKQSAIIINNELIITSGCILLPYVRPILPFVADHTNDNVCASTKIIHKLQQCRLVNAQDVDTDEAHFLNTLSYQVTFDRRKLPVSIAERRRNPNIPHILTRYGAKLLYIFSSNEISRNLHKMLNSLTFNESQTKEHNEVLITSFLVLTMRPDKTTESPEKFERFLEHIAHYLRYIHTIRPLDDVLTMCTPFGLENFYKTINIGKVSNVIGKNGSLFVLSNNLPLGCEGSAVFNDKLRLIGLIISTTFQRNNENLQMTMAANFAYLLRDFMNQLGIKITSITIPREPSNFAWERTMVVIEANGNQGTGTFVKVQNKKFIITCSHVVFQVNSKVYCRGVDGEFEADVLWCNPNYDTAFDVALLSAPSNIPTRYCVRMAQTKPCLGQTVYNAGFPYFVNFNLKYDFNPSIFQGRIIKYTPAAIMSDGCVQAGQSGGPMFDEHGNIMGVCVSNIKMDKVVYPNINNAIPIVTIRSILENYAKTNDVLVLNNLVANSDIQRIWSLAPPPVISKL
ncbi:peroxisomal leader peptide-processing protease [Stomoxys calcitrans]|uniref:peroxisomal leader peptide-processing protease n=1 Tax=Stomoxys calcitrans TaxID=35570 RepID=UPI0027E24241|nr:peroxisomal leader peptide-processing protease [Stomoxys calcitrans]XP_059225346.1 peroxisomal leader peptide-processing protease [Stomoxys calcitrans]